MALEIRPIELGEFEEYQRVLRAAFGSHLSTQDAEIYRPFLESAHPLGAFLDGQIAGTTGHLSFSLTVPGPTTTSAAGVTMVGVLPTQRRKGVMRSLMRRQLDDMRERGDPLALLLASESLLYGRYGYGAATTQVDLEIDPRFSRFESVPEADGELDFLKADQARGVLPGIYDRARRQEPGQIDRDQTYWDLAFRDREEWRHGASALFYVVYRSPAGAPDGYVSYRFRDKWEHGMPAKTVIIDDLMAVTPDSYAALWQYCLSLDLVAMLQAHGRPTDEPVHWMLADPRRLRVTDRGDFLWARLLDIPKALEARRYNQDGVLTVEIVDAFCPDVGGCYRLSIEGGQARVQRTTSDPDLAMAVNDLSAAYLGGVRFSTLARAGRVEERTDGALRRGDLMFLGDRAPWSATDF